MTPLREMYAEEAKETGMSAESGGEALDKATETKEETFIPAAKLRCEALAELAHTCERIKQLLEAAEEQSSLENEEEEQGQPVPKALPKDVVQQFVDLGKALISVSGFASKVSVSTVPGVLFKGEKGQRGRRKLRTTNDHTHGAQVSCCH